jgi:hypothetical protein
MSVVVSHPGAARSETSVSLPLLGDDAVRAAVEAERRRLLHDAGLSVGPIAHFKRPVERGFTKQERGAVTIWTGGLTMRHEELIRAGLEGLGYKIGLIPRR